MRPKVIPNPVEWSFREIDEIELAGALEYELARESNLIRPAVEKLLSLRIGKKTAREMILSGIDTELHKAQAALLASRESLKLISFAMQNPLFPNPWNLLEPEDRIAVAKEAKIMEGPALRIITDPNLAAIHLASMSRFKDSIYINAAFTIDTSKRDSKYEILEQFKAWLNKTLTARKLPRGKAATPPWDVLKALAALRLSKYGLGYSEEKRVAMDQAANRFEYAKTQGGSDVLPIYAKPQGRSRALRVAREAIKALERKFLELP